ncbi:hypothetical protein HQO42_18985 [Rhodococcus fascians]|nr:hypothetical protein [Rhodococcus fascians]MBY4238674.1 hypothetical protein [Rhodococcus fascians]MBY4254737.1 hypothetical protein [Rhodococcus fascians]MBY4270029.1 hypothetical protein [Rhodococcus fascians]
MMLAHGAALVVLRSRTREFDQNRERPPGYRQIDADELVEGSYWCSTSAMDRIASAAGKILNNDAWRRTRRRSNPNCSPTDP